MIERLIEFAEAGNQQKIVVSEGTTYQGWVMEITDQALLMSTGYHEKSGQDIWLSLEQLRHAQLYYWAGQWLPFHL